MGDFSEHVLFGASLGTVFFVLTSQYIDYASTEVLAAFLTILIGSVLPDIDLKNSYVFRSTKAFVSILAGAIVFIYANTSVLNKFSFAVAAFLLAITFFRIVPVHHRGLTHTIRFAVILSSISVIAGVITVDTALPGIGLFIGLMSHLLLDGEILS